MCTRARKRFKPDTNRLSRAGPGVSFATRRAGFVAFGTKPFQGPETSLEWRFSL